MFFPIPTNPRITETPVFNDRPYVSGFEMTVVSTTVATFEPGCGRGVNPPSNIFYPPINANAPGIITLDVTTIFAPGGLGPNGEVITGTAVGFGGCYPLPLSQTGLAGDDTVFPLFAIGDSTGKLPTTIIIPTSGAFLPAGYDSFVRVGQIYIDGTTFHIIPTKQTGSYEVRHYQLGTAIMVLDAGAATSATLVNLSAGDGPITPGFTSEVHLNAVFTPDAQADLAHLGATGVTGLPIAIQNAAAGKASTPVKVVPGVDATTGDAGVNYRVTSADDALTLEVSGWTDDMSVYLR